MTSGEIRLDLCVLADLRLGDAAGAAHAAGIAALCALGYRVGMLSLAPEAIAADTGAMDPAWAALIASGRITRLARGARVEARLALALDSRILLDDLSRAIDLRAQAAVVTVERPAHLAALSTRDLDRLAARADAVLGAPVTWAPSNAMVRDALAHIAPHWRLSDADWPLALPDITPVPRPATQRSRPVAGRARLARVRGRDDVPSAGHLADPSIAWRLRLAPDLPRPPWPTAAPVELWPDTAITLSGFLSRIDALALPETATEDPCPIEALVAIAAGVVPVLSPGHRLVFGAAALYAEPRDLPRMLSTLHDSPALRDEVLSAGRRLLDRLHRPEDFARRLAAGIGTPRADAFAPAILARPSRTVLFYSTNGVGMGHLTRQLAIARRLPPQLAPAFVSHSQAVDVVRRFGFPAEHLPYHTTYAQNRAHWNATLVDRLDAALAFWQPAALVFDGNVPFLGLIEALSRRPDIARAWIRRGLWGLGRDPDALERSAFFDMILEPGEPADLFDDGPTALRKTEALQVPPVRLLDPDDLPDRATACAELGLDPAHVNILVAPGSGNNAATQDLADRAIAALACRPGIGVALAEWRIATRAQSLPPGVVRLVDFPFARSLPAFDAAIAAAGYNTFAEHLGMALPTIWVPNEAPEQDQQILRARFASEAGLGLALRLTEPFLLQTALTRMLSAPERSGFVARGRAFAARHLATNGAVAAVDALAALCDSLPSRRPPIPVDATPCPMTGQDRFSGQTQVQGLSPAVLSRNLVTSRQISEL